MTTIPVNAGGTVTSYLRFPIVVHDERELSIYTPQGRLIFKGRCSLSSARAIVRGYRKEGLA